MWQKINVENECNCIHQIVKPAENKVFEVFDWIKNKKAHIVASLG